LLNLFRDIFPAARCVLLICFLSTTNTPQLAAGIFYSLIEQHLMEKMRGKEVYNTLENRNFS
jgi:hypothetical protein